MYFALFNIHRWFNITNNSLNTCPGFYNIFPYLSKSILNSCGPTLVTEPNIVWRLVTVLAAIVLVTTTLAFGCLLCQILPCSRCVWKIHERGWHNPAGSSSDGQVIWVVRLSSNLKNIENRFLLKYVCETINNKQTILLDGCTTWTQTKSMEKKLDGNYARMLRAILNKSWRQHSRKQQLYGHLSPITKTIQVRLTRHAGHCWRSRDELISDVLLWTPYTWSSKGRVTSSSA